MLNLLQKMSLHFLLAFLLIGCAENFDDDEIRFGIAQKPQQLDPRFQSDAAWTHRLHTAWGVDRRLQGP